jgi:formylglycine-generating enzyme required for sulfatase activity
MDNTLGNALATQMGSNLTSGGQYALTSVNTTGKRDELRATYASGGGSSINRSTLAEWGRTNGISVICLVVDDVKGSDHMFYAQLIDAKDSKLSGKGSYVRTGVGSGDLPRVSSALAQQLNGSGRRRSAPAPVRSYPAELDIEMVFVQGGAFQMGCISGQSGCNAEETPHSVTVRNFYIGKYEITQAQWSAVTGNNPSSNKTDDQQPVEMVAWGDVVETFISRLNALTGKNYRLPTEAEWEYAARGGIHNSTYNYSGSNTRTEVGWQLENNFGRPAPVGQKKPNALGIYDMSGNVWEWCSDWYSASYYKTSPTDNPTGPPSGTAYVRRGGSWSSDGGWSRVTARHYSPSGATGAGSHIGVRVVLPAQ